MEKHGFKIIAIVFWVWFSACQLYMHYGFVENPPLIKTLTTASIAFLGTSTCSICFLYDDLNKKFLPLCIISLMTVYIFICLNYFGCWVEPRAKLIGIGIVVIPVTLFFNKLYKF